MTNIVVQVINLKEVDKETFRALKKLSFGNRGWMTECMDQVINGFAVKTFYDSKIDETAVERVPVVYNKAHALIARNEDGKIVGWAMVRHPSRRIALKYKKYDWRDDSYINKVAYAGRRSDFMVYVSKKNRKKQIARKLLLVAYNNFGRMDVYPHDAPSVGFYDRNKSFVTAYNTNHFHTAHFQSREVY